MHRPCSEIKKEIEDDTKTIRYIKRDLKDPKYQNIEQQKMLRFRLDGIKMQLLENYRKYLHGCKSNTILDHCAHFNNLMNIIAEINFNKIKDNNDKVKKYLKLVEELDDLSASILTDIQNSNNFEEQLVYIEYYFAEISANIRSHYAQNIGVLAVPFLKKLKSICQFNILQNVYDIDVDDWEKINNRISGCIDEAMRYNK